MFNLYFNNPSDMAYYTNLTIISFIIDISLPLYIGVTLDNFQSFKTRFVSRDAFANFVMIGVKMSEQRHNNLLSKPCTSVLLDSPRAYKCALIDFGCIAMNSNLAPCCS